MDPDMEPVPVPSVSPLLELEGRRQSEEESQAVSLLSEPRTERRLNFSSTFDDAVPNSGDVEGKAVARAPPAAPPPGVVGQTPAPEAPDGRVVEAARYALHGDDTPQGRDDSLGVAGVEEALLQEVEQLREQAAYDADALATAQYEHEVLQARVQALEADLVNAAVQRRQLQAEADAAAAAAQAAQPATESEAIIAALRKDVQELEHLLEASQKENERATVALKAARAEAAERVAAAEMEVSAVKSELALMRTETRLAGGVSRPSESGHDIDGVDAVQGTSADHLRRVLSLEAALREAQDAAAENQRAAMQEVEELREQVDALQRQLAARHSDAARAHMREASSARAAAAVVRTSSAGVDMIAARVADAQTQAPPARMNEKLLRQLRAEHEAVRSAYEERLAVSEAAAAKGVTASARVRALERELTEVRAHASRRVRAVQDESAAAVRERDVLAQEVDAVRKDLAAARRRENDMTRREKEAKAKCQAAEEAAAVAKEELRQATQRLQTLEAAQQRLVQQARQRNEDEVSPPPQPDGAPHMRRSSSAGARLQPRVTAPSPPEQQQQQRASSDDVAMLQRKLEAAHMSLQAMTRAHSEAVEKAAAARLESEKALWQLQAAHAERLDAMHKDKLAVESELKTLLAAAGDASAASPDDVRYALAAAARRADAAEQRAAQLDTQLRLARQSRGGAAQVDSLAGRVAAAEAAAAKLAARVEAREAECRVLIREIARLEAAQMSSDGGAQTPPLEDVSRALDARKLEVTRFRAALDAVLQGATGKWEATATGTDTAPQGGGEA